MRILDQIRKRMRRRTRPDKSWTSPATLSEEKQRIIRAVEAQRLRKYIAERRARQG